MALLSKTPLDERVTAIRAEIDAIIDARVKELRKEYALPDTWLRHDLTKGACQCVAFLALKAADDKAKAREETAA